MEKLKGLTSQQVDESRAKHGTNVLTPPKRESVLKLFLEKFNDPIIRILLVAACLSLVVAVMEREYAETIGIFGAFLLATGVAFYFEYDAKRRFERLNQVNDDTPVKVVRDGQVMEIPKRDVVVGDVVMLDTGEEIPADGVLVDSVSMGVNESALTGEMMIGKHHDPAENDDQATYPSNRLYRGTTVVEGHGVLIVDAVGDQTEFGKVAFQSTKTSEAKTPLTIQLERLSGVIGRVGMVLAIGICVIMAVKGYLSGDLTEGNWVHLAEHLLQYFMVAVAVIVMSVPEGLPMSITLSLALNMRRMLKTNNLVRKMHACETMGAVTVICTDKTGTLTQNQMRVHNIELLDCNEDLMCEAIAVNSTAMLDAAGKVIGNPTEGALLLWMNDRDVDYAPYRQNLHIVDQMTFTTERKYMATLVESRELGERVLYVKGAPEIVRLMCAEGGKDKNISKSLADYQNKAMRTLAFACRRTKAASCEEAVLEELSLMAIAAISDPVRADVPAAVASCMDAGIRIKIVTGDTSATAREIARQIGLWDPEKDGERNHMTGPEFEAASDEELLERLKDLKVMSRARPLDKQRLVQLLQKQGEVVAVTGDGTNDAPALNFAQVGLSMGDGTSVAKDASDITLLDNSFASIATAVMWGRSLYKNIQRFVLFQLTINVAAVLVVIVGSIFGSEMPLTVTQILWVNLIMDTFAAMALSSLPPDPAVMKAKPRRKEDFIITRQMGWQIVCVGAIFVVALLGLLNHFGPEPTIYQLSAFFTVFVMMQVWNLFNAKGFGARGSVFADMRRCGIFLLVLVVILAGQWLIVTFGGEVFRTEPLSARDWLMIFLWTSPIMILGEVARWIGRLVKK